MSIQEHSAFIHSIQRPLNGMGLSAMAALVIQHMHAIQYPCSEQESFLADFTENCEVIMVSGQAKPKTPRTASTSEHAEKSMVARVFKVLDQIVYTLIGAAFVGAALVTLAISFKNIGEAFGTKTFADLSVQTVLDFVSDLLLVLIIMEVLGTIRSYLEEGDATVRPFLFIGIISATRGILSIGASLSVPNQTQPLSQDEFRNKMIELGINALVILALGITIRVMGDYANTKDDESSKGKSAETVGQATAAAASEQVTVVLSPHHHDAGATESVG